MLSRLVPGSLRAQLALAIAVWRAHGGGMAQYGHFEWMRWQAMGSKAPEPRYYVGVDLGQSRDPTAIAVVRRVDPPRPAPEPTYAPGSLEWEQEQRRQKNKAAPGWLKLSSERLSGRAQSS